MRKLVLAALVSAALALPLSPAGATGSGPGAGVKDCPPGYTGWVLWIDNALTGYREPVRFCIPFGP